MTINFSVDSLEGLDESVAGLYRESEDGKFVLDVSDAKPIEEFTKVHSLLQQERNERKTMQEKLKAFGDRTPDAFYEMEDKIQELQAMTGEFNEDKVNELLDLKMKPVNRQMERVQKERDEALEALTNMKNEINQSKRDSSLMDAANGKIKQEFFTDLRLRAQHMLEYNEQMGEWLDESGMNIQEWVNEQIKATPSWQPESAGAGTKSQSKATNVSPANNPFSKDTFNLTEQGRLYKENPKEYERLKALANK